MSSKRFLQDLTVRWEWTVSAFEDEKHVIKYTHSLSASGLFDHILWPSLWLRLAIWHNNDSRVGWRESLLAPTCFQLNLFVVIVSWNTKSLYLVEEEPANRAATKYKESSPDLCVDSELRPEIKRSLFLGARHWEWLNESGGPTWTNETTEDSL